MIHMSERLNTHFSKIISSFSVWAISFGCIVGWGAFVMPGTTFIPMSGAVGSSIAMLIGALVIIVIAANFHSMMNCPSLTGSLFSYTKEIFGYDHSLLCVWSIMLAYISILWANATSIALIVRFLFGSVLQWGFHYTLAGYDVYLGEILVTEILLVAFGLFSARCHRAVRFLQCTLALVLFVGVVACFWAALSKIDVPNFSPAFAMGETSEKHPVLQVLNIVALAPWAFIGFETVSLLPRKSKGAEQEFPRKKSFLLMALAIFCGMATYVLLTLISVLPGPSNAQDSSSLPTFNAIRTILGKNGVITLIMCVVSAISTSIFGMYRAAGKLMRTMAEDDVLPAWLAVSNKKGLPENAITFIMTISLLIPFLGRTAIGWIVDVTTISASIAYAYISASTFVTARREKCLRFQISGIIGLCATIFFFFPLIPNPWNMNSLATESYLILAAWSIIGLILFWIVFQRDKKNRVGKSTIMWFAMLFIILFSSIMWMRQVTHEQTEQAIENISMYHKETHVEEGIPMTAKQETREKDFMEKQMAIVRKSQFSNSVIQFVLIMATLVIMFNIFSTQQKREKKLSDEKSHAEESSKSKSTFLFNMSHDIRTPMNAIIGYTTLAQRDGVTLSETREFLKKIDSSSKHLLALINDVLEMSRIESGKMELEEVPCDLRRTMEEIRDMFTTQMETKHIHYTVDYASLKNPLVFCDKNRLNRVLLNLISNAFKFTDENGRVSVSLTDRASETTPSIAQYELCVKDNGIGMSSEFAAKVFDAFEREKTSTVSGIQGTGLGMAITTSIIDLMGGKISVKSQKGKGTEFIIQLALKLQDSGKKEQQGSAGAEENTQAAMGGAKKAVDFSTMRLLLVEDMDVNREIAVMLLSEMGFSVESAVNGQEAVEKVSEAEAGYFDAVLMDIQMPIMDGYEATQKIRLLADNKKASVPIIAMTANAFSEDVQKALAAGMNAHIAKPIDITTLTKTLTDCLSRQ